MKNGPQNDEMSSFEHRSQVLFRESVDGLDYTIRSRLTEARHAALEAAAQSSRRPSWLRMGLWTPAAGVAAAALLGVALWFAGPSGRLSGNHAATADAQTNLEDLDMVASSDPASGDAIEMLQDDLDFYDFADKASNSGPAA
jgi:hypothetical protein